MHSIKYGTHISSKKCQINGILFSSMKNGRVTYLLGGHFSSFCDHMLDTANSTYWNHQFQYFPLLLIFCIDTYPSLILSSCTEISAILNGFLPREKFQTLFRLSECGRRHQQHRSFTAPNSYTAEALVSVNTRCFMHWSRVNLFSAVIFLDDYTGIQCGRIF